MTTETTETTKPTTLIEDITEFWEAAEPACRAVEVREALTKLRLAMRKAGMKEPAALWTIENKTHDISIPARDRQEEIRAAFIAKWGRDPESYES